MSEQERDPDQSELNDEGAGLGLDDEPNTFEPEEDPDSTGEPDETDEA